jgi:WD40 repeat protein
MSNQTNKELPYKGLESYTEQDAELLFGRSEERDRLIYSLHSFRLTILYGARQVGKTSLLRAAVLNQLRREAKKRQSASNALESLVVLFDDWSGPGALTRLRAAIDREIEHAGVPESELCESGNSTFVERCGQWTNCLGGRAGGELFLLLDDFDRQLAASPHYESEPDSFDSQLSEVLSTRGLGVNVIIAIRDELLSYLDKYSLSIPGLFNNLFRLDPLTRKQAKEAIVNPVYSVYNKAHVDDKIGIEAELVAAILDAVALKTGPGASTAPGEQRYDAGGLQLAMRAVWEEEQRQGSRTLKCSTFANTLGGIRGIASTYIDERFAAFSLKERYLSARVFDNLLTPGGVGLSYQLSDLASRVGVDAMELECLIQKLKKERMISTSVSGETLSSVYHEMANRVLTPAALERVQWYHLECEHAEKDLIASIDTSLRLFFQSSQVDGLIKIIDTCDKWSEGVRNLLVNDALQGDLRIALGKIVEHLRQKGQFSGYKGAVSSVQYSVDGNLILTGTESGAITAWDIRTPGAIGSAIEQKHKTWIWGLCASPDGKWFATGSDDGTAALWAVINAGVRYERAVPLSGNSGASPLVRGLNFSPDGTLLAIATTDGAVRVWDVRQNAVRCDFKASHRPVRTVEFAPDGCSIATGADDGIIGLWNLKGEPLVRENERSLFKHEAAVWKVRFHPRGGRLASCSEDHRIKVWNLVDRVEERTFIGHTCWVLDLQYNFDGSLLASASEDGTARIWDEGGNALAVFVHGAPVNGVAFSPDGQTLATAAADCKLRLWHTQQSRTRRTRKQFWHPNKAILLDVSFSCDGNLVAAGGTDNEVQIWDEDGRLRQALPGHNGWIMSVVFHPKNPSLVATGSVDGTARAWNVLDRSSKQFMPNDGPVWSLAFDPEGSLLATGSAGGKVCAWPVDEPQGSPAFCFSSCDHGSCWSVAFSPDGRWVAAGYQDGAIRVRDISGREIMELRGVHSGQVLSLSFSPNENYLVSSSSEGRFCVWDLPTGRSLRFRDLDAPIWSVRFSRTGEILASGSVDRSVCLWNLNLERLSGHSAEGPVRGLTFNRNGDWLAASCSDGTVRLWPVGKDDFKRLLDRAKADRQEILPLLCDQALALHVASV